MLSISTGLDAKSSYGDKKALRMKSFASKPKYSREIKAEDFKENGKFSIGSAFWALES
jgi:hypothetical protein